jgi:uncharacterized membrane protein YfcA
VRRVQTQCMQLNMDHFLGLDSFFSLVFVLVVALFAGLVKGVVGFAMPTILISGLTLVLAPEQALAALIIPTLVTNGWQALRQGIGRAIETVVQFRLFLACGLIMLVMSAQLVRILDVRILYGMIGAPIALFAVLQLAGWHPKLAQRSARIEAAVGGFAGFIGGMSGIWGPPTVAYLTAIDTAKQDQMRAQGVIYGLAAVALAGSHIQTGVFRVESLPLTFLILPLALVGVWLGFRVQDRIPQAAFRSVTLVVLVFAGLNLLRRAMFG